MSLSEISHRLGAELERLTFAPPVAYVYNPVLYAREPHQAYLERYGAQRGRVVLVGMNPGPFGMAQTGVPFGEVGYVRDWMRISGHVAVPERCHPKRPVEGFSCGRSEVSGSRLWGWAKDRFKQPEQFFARFFVLNYCPLAFVEESGRNLTPDKLPAHEREPLFTACDAALGASLTVLEPRLLVGVGAFAQGRIRKVVDTLGIDVPVGAILHPSPASPKANRGWARVIEQQLAELGCEL